MTQNTKAELSASSKSRPKLRTITHPEKCKACGYCIRECPKKAISFGEEVNTKGYNFACVDQDLCIACGICYLVCPDYVFEQVEEVCR